MSKSRVLVTMVAAGLAAPPVAFGQDATKVDKGKAVFADRKCKICHSVGGVGNAKGPLDGVADRLRPMS